MSEIGYQFKTFLRGHTSDVRCITVSEDGSFLATVSRDNTCRLWRLEGATYDDYLTFQYSSKYGLFVKYHKFPQYEAVLIGGVDRTVYIREIRKGEAICNLLGHLDAVSSIEVIGDKVVSGSWDTTIKVWTLDGYVYKTLTDHSAAVWCIAKIDNGFLSGSADSTIIYWKNYESMRTFEGHKGPVRDILVLENGRFLSCSNDYTIRLWSLASSESMCLEGHCNYVYSMCLLSQTKNSYTFASCGEENCIKIWKDGKLSEDILVPTSTNWCVRKLPDNCIIIGSNYVSAMIFQKHINPADSFDLEEYDNLMTESQKSKDLGVDINCLQSVEDGLKRNGKFDGETVMWRKGNDAVIYEWKESTQTWDYLGSAMRQLNNEEQGSSKVTFRGVEYDHVIEVELDSGRKLKLPYNNGEDPSFAATRFIEDNNLSTFFHQQIVDFLIANIPSSCMKPDKKTASQEPPSAQFPINDYAIFPTTNVVGLFKRLASLPNLLKESEMALLKKFVEGSLNKKNLSLSFDDFPWISLNVILPVERFYILPTLDMIKQLVLYEPFFEHFFHSKGNWYRLSLLEFVKRFTNEKVEEKCRMLALRIFCNSFLHAEKFESDFIRDLAEINTIIYGLHLWVDPIIQTSSASVALNFSVFCAKIKYSDMDKIDCFLGVLVWSIEAYKESLTPDTICLLLSSFGNILFMDLNFAAINSKLIDLKVLLEGLELDSKASGYRTELKKKLDKLIE